LRRLMCTDAPGGERSALDMQPCGLVHTHRLRAAKRLADVSCRRNYRLCGLSLSTAFRATSPGFPGSWVLCSGGRLAATQSREQLHPPVAGLRSTWSTLRVSQASSRLAASLQSALSSISRSRLESSVPRAGAPLRRITRLRRGQRSRDASPPIGGPALYRQPCGSLASSRLAVSLQSALTSAEAGVAPARFLVADAPLCSALAGSDRGQDHGSTSRPPLTRRQDHGLIAQPPLTRAQVVAGIPAP